MFRVVIPNPFSVVAALVAPDLRRRVTVPFALLSIRQDRWHGVLEPSSPSSTALNSASPSLHELF